VPERRKLWRSRAARYGLLDDGPTGGGLARIAGEIEFMGLQIQSAQYAYAYFYWTLPDNSCRGDESRGAAGRPGTDY
jgi:hypothetical protein